MPIITPQLLVKAHQYLYYVQSCPMWSDYEYDQFCKKHGIPENGGSDRECDYTAEEKSLALDICKNPRKYPPDMEVLCLG